MLFLLTLGGTAGGSRPPIWYAFLIFHLKCFFTVELWCTYGWYLAPSSVSSIQVHCGLKLGNVLILQSIPYLTDCSFVVSHIIICQYQQLQTRILFTAITDWAVMTCMHVRVFSLLIVLLPHCQEVPYLNFG